MSNVLSGITYFNSFQTTALLGKAKGLLGCGSSLRYIIAAEEELIHAETQDLSSWKSLQHCVPCKTEFTRVKLQLDSSHILIVVYFWKGTPHNFWFKKQKHMLAKSLSLNIYIYSQLEKENKYIRYFPLLWWNVVTKLDLWKKAFIFDYNSRGRAHND